MNPKPVIIACLALMIFVAPLHGKAALVVNRSVVIFDNPSIRSKDVLARNQNQESPLYLKVDVMDVINPGSNNESLAPLIGPEPDFLASPNRIVVSPGGKSLVRLLNLDQASEIERVYRVNIIPMAPPVELELPERATRSKLEVMLAYQVLVVILPANPNAKVNVNRIGREVTFRNDGNANYLLTSGQQCNPEKPEECVALESRRIYANTVWHLELPFDAPFSYKVRTANEITSREFD